MVCYAYIRAYDVGTNVCTYRSIYKFCAKKYNNHHNNNLAYLTRWRDSTYDVVMSYCF